MSEFVNNTMSLIIIGDQDNKEFDGQVKYNGRKEGFFYHRDSIKQIVKEFNKEGYDLRDINQIDSNEAGFDLVNKGHILFCNCTMEDYSFGYLFIPEDITDKQIESLKTYEKNFQEFQELYVMKLNEKDKETFETNIKQYNFNVDELTATHYHSKSR